MRTWSPDTCGCKIEEVYDGTTITGAGQVLNKCPAHADVPDNDLYGVLYANPDGENKRKNQVYAMLIGQDENFTEDLGLSEARDGKVQLKAGVTYDWLFTGSGKDRVLNVMINGTTLTTQQKTNLASECVTRFGSGKVSVK